jgi:hypothetical protein
VLEVGYSGIERHELLEGPIVRCDWMLRPRSGKGEGNKRRRPAKKVAVIKAAVKQRCARPPRLEKRRRQVRHGRVLDVVGAHELAPARCLPHRAGLPAV